MMRQILINVEPYEKRVAITCKGMLEEFHVERTDQAHLAGGIYKGVAESLVPGIGAIFVNIGTGKNGFLYMDDVEENARKGLKKGSELLVQVVKEPIGTKGPLLTTDISLPGKYLVFTPFSTTLGISKRIEDRKERAKIKDILEKSNLPRDVGCIARTQSLGAGPRQLRLEIRFLMNLWQRIKRRVEQEKAPSLIYEEYDLPMRIIRDYYEGDIERILVDSKEEYKKVSRFASSVQSRIRRKIFYYRGKTSLYEKYGIEEEIGRIFQRKINLKSGGTIVIEKTESLTSVDVNTGRFVGKRNPEETAFKTNVEAARELARQIMLRDIGGIIVIDFIDMDDRSHRKSVYGELEAAFQRDKAKIQILPVSHIGLVEMTRQRVRKTIESVSFRECPYCNGMGRVKKPSTIAIGVIRKLSRVLADRRSREISLVAHPDVAECLKSSFKDVLNSFERRFRKKIAVKTDSKVHVEDVYFE